MASAVSQLGAFLFRWRSYLPLILLAPIGIAIAKLHQPAASPASDYGWEILCVATALVGWMLRCYIVGVAAPGTSGRQTRSFKAASLNTTGPYSVVRHPLYLSNLVIIVALSSFPHVLIVPPVVGLAAIAYYACIARREEDFLRERFGDMFDRWAARVPMMMPAPGLWVPSDHRFDWRIPLRREYYALALVLILPVMMDAAEHFKDSGRITFDPLWAPMALLGAAAFLVCRILKKRRRGLPARNGLHATARLNVP